MPSWNLRQTGVFFFVTTSMALQLIVHEVMCTNPAFTEYVREGHGFFSEMS